MTLQEQFNTVVRGLAKQEWRQSREPVVGECLYRHPDGRRCSIGHLIPDEKYEPAMEGDVVTLLERYPALEEFLPSEFIAVQWQDFHDSMTSRAGMIADFVAWGEKNGLTWPEDVAKTLAPAEAFGGGRG